MECRWGFAILETVRGGYEACYVNSLLQSYFMLPEFVEAVMRFKQPVLPSD